MTDQPQPAAVASIVIVLPEVLPSSRSGSSAIETVTEPRFASGRTAVQSAIAWASAASAAAAERGRRSHVRIGSARRGQTIDRGTVRCLSGHRVARRVLSTPTAGAVEAADGATGSATGAPVSLLTTGTFANGSAAAAAAGCCWEFRSSSRRPGSTPASARLGRSSSAVRLAAPEGARVNAGGCPRRRGWHLFVSFGIASVGNSMGDIADRPAAVRCARLPGA